MESVRLAAGATGLAAVSLVLAAAQVLAIVRASLGG